MAAIAVLFLAASSAPSPIYVIYQQRWQFTALALTVVFALYVAGLLGSLLVVGALSDHLGRRPVLAAAIGLEMISLVLFYVAGDVFVLSAARVLQSIATGAAVTALSATLVDLEPAHARGRAAAVFTLANIVAYLGNSVPAVLGGTAATALGLRTAAEIYALTLMVIIAAALVLRLNQVRAERRAA